MTRLLKEREVLVISTASPDPVTIKSTAGTYGSIKNQLISEVGLNLNKMKMIIGETQHTLEADGAMLPTDKFTLYALPKKVKSGKMTRKEAYAEIKRLISIHGDKAKSVFNKDKNYTNKGNDEIMNLIKRVAGWKVKAKSDAGRAPKKTVAKPVAAKKKAARGKTRKQKPAKSLAESVTNVVESAKQSKVSEFAASIAALEKRTADLEAANQAMAKGMVQLKSLVDSILNQAKQGSLSLDDHKANLARLKAEFNSW